MKTKTRFDLIKEKLEKASEILFNAYHLEDNKKVSTKIWLIMEEIDNLIERTYV